MAFTVGELIAKIVADTRKFERGMDRVDRKLKGSGRSSKDLSLNFRKVAVAGAAVTAAVAASTVALGRFTQAGGRNLAMLRAFERRAGRSTGALKSMQAATRNLVAEQDLMLQFNRAVTLGAADNVAQFNQLAEASLALSRAMGIDAAFALESMSLGIGRQSRLILDNLGLIVSVEEANRAYAKSLNKTVAQLTEAEKKEAFRLAALTQAERKVAELGGVVLNAGDAWTELTVEIDNTVAATQRAAAESTALKRIFQGLSRVVRDLRGDYEDLNAERAFAIARSSRPFEAGGRPDPLAGRRISGLGAGGATQFFQGGRGRVALQGTEELNQVREAMAAFEQAREALEELLQPVRDFESELRRLESRLERIGDLEPRDLTEAELLAGQRQTGPASFRGRGRFPVSAGRGFVDRSAAAMARLAQQTTETAQRLGDTNEGLSDFDVFLQRLGSRFDSTSILSTAAGGLLSSGISTAIGAIGDALFGDDYVTALERNTRALRRLAGDTSDLERILEEIPGSFDDLRAEIQDFIAQVRAESAFDLARRRADATDASPSERFRLIQRALAGNVAGPLGVIISALTEGTVDEFLNTVLTKIEQGTFDPALLGNLTLDQFLDALGELENLADNAGLAADELGELAGALRNAPSGFKTAFARFTATTGEILGSSDVVTDRGVGNITIPGPVIVVSNDPDRVLTDIERQVKKKARRGGVSELQLAGTAEGVVRGGRF